ncbi:MAG: ABC transporter permease [Fimbriimonadaceae bacterium]|nr:ABC transporter permease [Fimbriimonadaceae bacterium]
MNDFLTFAMNVVALGLPLVLAALGGLVSERSGIMNIALEGKLLGAACATSLVAASTGSPILGLGAGLLTATILSLGLVWLTQSLRIDHVVAGMAINLISLGGTNFAAKALIDQNQLSGAPTLAKEMYWGLGVLAAVVIIVGFARTRPGLHLFAVGEDPHKSRQMGLSPIRVRVGALLTTGILCGLGGALILTNAGGFTDGMTAGRGFIALAAVILAGWRPGAAVAAALAFGAIEALRIQLQGAPVFGVEIPTEAWASLPYIATLIALTGFLGKTSPPAGLGRI